MLNILATSLTRLSGLFTGRHWDKYGYLAYWYLYVTPLCHIHTSYVPHTSMGSSFKSICHLLEDGKPEEMEIIYCIFRSQLEKYFSGHPGVSVRQVIICLALSQRLCLLLRLYQHSLHSLYQSCLLLACLPYLPSFDETDSRALRCDAFTQFSHIFLYYYVTLD
jgi:hypothetical protein